MKFERMYKGLRHIESGLEVSGTFMNDTNINCDLQGEKEGDIHTFTKKQIRETIINLQIRKAEVILRLSSQNNGDVKKLSLKQLDIRVNQDFYDNDIETLLLLLLSA